MAPQLRTSLEAKRRRGRVNQRNESILLFTLGVRGAEKARGGGQGKALKAYLFQCFMGFLQTETSLVPVLVRRSHGDVSSPPRMGQVGRLDGISG